MHELTPEWYVPRNDIKLIDNITAKIGTGINNIKVFENFLTDQEVETGMRIITKYPVVEGADHSYPIHTLPSYVETLEEKFFSPIMSQKMKKIAKNSYGINLLDDKQFLYVVHPKGTRIDPHTDILDIDNTDYENDTYESELDLYPYLWSGHLSILAYLNDDYEGGELYFPELDWGVRPKKKMLIMFPGSLHYVHGVAEIKSGTRYTLSQWAQFEGFNPRPQNTNKEMI
jgi:hypothetical protein